MKIYIFFIGLFFLLSLNQYAQDNFYIKSSFGYSTAFGIMKTTISTPYGYSSNRMTRDIVFGKGVNGALCVGYDFSNNLSIELFSSYFTRNTYKTTLNVYSFQLGNIIVNQSLNLNMFQIAPLFIISTTKHIITPYCKVGPIFGFSTILKEESLNHNNEQSILKMFGGRNYGITTGIGAKYSINSKLQIFSEINYINMTISPLKGNYTKFTINGVDMIFTIPNDSKEFYFVDDPGSPTVTTNGIMVISKIKPYYLYNSLSFNIGIKFIIDKTSVVDTEQNIDTDQNNIQNEN